MKAIRNHEFDDADVLHLQEGLKISSGAMRFMG